MLSMEWSRCGRRFGFAAAAAMVAALALWACSPPAWAGGIADHVSHLGVSTGDWYMSPDDPNPRGFGFDIEVITDATVLLIEFVTPGGQAFQIPNAPQTSTDNVWTEREELEGNRWQWDYEFWAEYDYSDGGSQFPYTDGTYTIRAYYTGGASQETTLWFGVPGSEDPIALPMAVPDMTSPDYGTTTSPVTFEWLACFDPDVNTIGLDLENRSSGEDPWGSYAGDATGSDPFTLSAGLWEVDLYFYIVHDIEDNGDGIPAHVLKYTAVPSFFVIPKGQASTDAISKHVYSCSIEFSVSDMNPYEFDMEIVTDATVALIQFQPPGGDTYQMDYSVYSESEEFDPDHKSGTALWDYWDQPVDDTVYGDGNYIITVYYTDGRTGQATVWFGIPDTQLPVPQPTQIPVLTSPQPGGSALTPVTLEWEACTDDNAAFIELELGTEEEEDWALAEMYYLYPVSATGSDPLPLVAGKHWNLCFTFGQWFLDPANANGILVEVSKYAISYVGFEVEALPIVSIMASDPHAAEAACETGTFTVTRDGNTDAALTVYYTVAGTATNGTDYTKLTSPVTIAAGSATATITVTPKQDTLAEGNETVIVTLAASPTYTVDPELNHDTVVIEDDEPVVSIEPQDDASEEGQVPGSFMLTRTGSVAKALTVKFAMSGTAINGTDYLLLSGTVTMLAGAEKAVIPVKPKDDLLYEGRETVILTLTTSTTYAIDPGHKAATIVIWDNEPIVRIAAVDPNAAEQGCDPGSFIVTRMGTASTNLTVTYTISGTAANGTDYNTLTTTVKILAHSYAATITVTPKDDAIAEQPETVILTLSTSTGYGLDATQKSARVTIADNEPVVSIAATDAAASEQGPNTGEFTLTRTGGDQTKALTVSLSISGTATNGTDYNIITNSVVIKANESTAKITVTPKDDDLYESTETVIVTMLAGTAYTIAPGLNKDTVYIADNEPTVGVSASVASANEEGPVNGEFTILRSGGSTAKPLTVSFTLTGKAVNGTDYNTITTTAKILAGAGSVVIPVVVKDDAIYEGSETVIITLIGSAAFTLGQKTATVNITDNEPLISITASKPTASEEGPTAGEFTVAREGPTTKAVTVKYTVAGTATAATDYAKLSGSVDIPIGQASAAIAATPVDDLIAERDETVIVTLTASTAYGLDTQHKAATVTIQDNEPRVAIAALVNYVYEDWQGWSGEDGMGEDARAELPGEFIVWRTGSTAAALNVLYTITGTATNGTDYTKLTSPVTIPAGFDWAPIFVFPINDAVLENEETVIVTLAASTAYSIDADYKSGSVWIEDSRPEVGVYAGFMGDNGVWEDWEDRGASTGQFYVSVYGMLTTDLQVNYTITGTATNGTDYEKIGTFVIVDASQQWPEAFITMVPIDDQLVEHDETVIITLSASSAYHIDPWGKSATMLIFDNDIPQEQPIVSIQSTVPEVWEDWQSHQEEPGKVTVSRTGPTAAALVVKWFIAGDATNGVDYKALATSVTIPKDCASVVVSIEPINDTLLEDWESVELFLAPGTNYAIDTQANRASLSIRDDEVEIYAYMDWDQAIYTVWENWEARSGTPLDITIERTGRTTNDLVVNYEVAGTAIPGEDYVPLGGSLTIPAGQQSATIAVEPIDDQLLEGDEFIVIGLLPDGYILGPGENALVVMILDDEQSVSIEASDEMASEEGPETGTFDVTRSGDTTNALTVYYSIRGTATKGTDYATIASSLTIPAGQTTATITVTPVDDTIGEPTETVILTLLHAANSRYSVDPDWRSATVFIEDNEPVVSIERTANAEEEGLVNGCFTVTRIGSTAAALTVTYTSAGTATKGTDYTAPTGTVTILAGQDTATINVVPKQDALAEGDETVIVTLTGNSGYYVDPLGDTAQIMILDNEPVVSIEGTADAQEEGLVNGCFTVTRKAADITKALTVSYTVAGTAIKGTDYTALTGTVAIPAGETQALINVVPKQDTLVESDETVIVTLTATAAYSADPLAKSATIRILDNDVAP